MSIRDRSARYAKESILLLELNSLSLCSIQACILLGTVSRSEGDGAVESVYYSVASRMANLLDLVNAPIKSKIEGEINLRGKYEVRFDRYLSIG